MTATNIILTKDAAHLITDGLLTDSLEKKLVLSSKCYAYPHIGAAVAVRGLKDMGAAAADFTQKLGGTFDDVKESLSRNLRNYFQKPEVRALKDIFGQDWNALDIVVAGWSPKLNRPDAFFIVTHDKHPGVPGWQTIDTGPYMIAPTRADLMAEYEPKIAALIEKNAPPILLDTLAADLVNSQRAIESNVGGFAQVTTVTADSITSRVAARFPDKIGEHRDLLAA